MNMKKTSDKAELLYHRSTSLQQLAYFPYQVTFLIFSLLSLVDTKYIILNGQINLFKCPISSKQQSVLNYDNNETNK